MKHNLKRFSSILLLFFSIFSKVNGVSIIQNPPLAWFIPYYVEDGTCHLLLKKQETYIGCWQKINLYWPVFESWKFGKASSAPEKSQILENETQGLIKVPTALQTDSFFSSVHHAFKRFEPAAFPGPWALPKRQLKPGMCGLSLYDTIQDYPVYFFPVKKPSSERADFYKKEQAKWFKISDIINDIPQGQSLTKNLITAFEEFEQTKV